MSEDWPLSALATQLLVRGKVRREELVPLAFKELALRGVLRLQHVPRQGLRPSKVLLDYGPPVALPFPELVQLDEALRRHAPVGGKVNEVVNTLRAREDGILDALVGWGAHALQTQGYADIVTPRVLGIKVGRRLAVTKKGEALRDELTRRIAALPSAAALDEVPPAVLLLSEDSHRGELDRLLRDVEWWPADLDVGVFMAFDGSGSDGGHGGGHGGGDGGHGGH